jgi:hypothetical protein
LPLTSSHLTQSHPYIGVVDCLPRLARCELIVRVTPQCQRMATMHRMVVAMMLAITMLLGCGVDALYAPKEYIKTTNWDKGECTGNITAEGMVPLLTCIRNLAGTKSYMV